MAPLDQPPPPPRSGEKEPGAPKKPIFPDLFKAINSRNVTAFVLPNDIRARFEGYTAGDEGEYEEVTQQFDL